MRTQVLSTSRDRAMAQSDQFTNGIPPVPVFRSRPYFRKKALKNRVGRHDFDHEPKLRRSVHPANLIAWRDISSLCACPLVSRDILTIDRKSVVSGKSVSVRVNLGGRRVLKQKKTQ